MHFHLTHAVILLASFALSIVVIVLVAALLDLWEDRKPPFLNYFDSAYDRSVLRQVSFNQSSRVFQNLRPIRIDPADWRTQITGKPQQNRL
jgi:hypothetical protein